MDRVSVRRLCVRDVRGSFDVESVSVYVVVLRDDVSEVE